MNENEDGFTYIRYINGFAKIISKKEWERSWLRWWSQGQARMEKDLNSQEG